MGINLRDFLKKPVEFTTAYISRFLGLLFRHKPRFFVPNLVNRVARQDHNGHSQIDYRLNKDPCPCFHCAVRFIRITIRWMID